MSDLAATNCGNGCERNNDCCSIIWIIILLSLFCGNGSVFSRDNDGCGCGNNSCIWIIILLLFFCNGNSSSLFGNNGCGCNFGCGC
ncbi:MAG: chorion class high-cysteine HCB protein 13 [Roseburia sp.]|nr:chorion class high-cysteine HCB protein 13 [Roseburia sp.]